jgi:hypothetical protein
VEDSGSGSQSAVFRKDSEEVEEDGRGAGWKNTGKSLFTLGRGQRGVLYRLISCSSD